MDTYDTSEVKCLMPTEGSNRMNRSPKLLSYIHSGSSVVSTFLIGLVSGAAGGLLLGATAIVLLQSLELLGGNKLLMEELQKLVTVKGRHVGGEAGQNVSRLTCNDHQLNVGVSVVAEVFGVVSSMLSLAVGICVGLSVYSLLTKQYREAAKRKSVAVAGTVGLIVVAASGSVLGLNLERFLSTTSYLDVSMWFSVSIYLIALSFVNLILLTIVNRYFEFSSSFLFPVIVFILAPGAGDMIILTALFFKTKLVLVVALIPTMFGLYRLEKTHDFRLITAPVVLMLVLTEVFNVTNQPIVVLQALTSTDPISAVHEGVFVGLVASQLFTAAVGMSCYESWQRGEAGLMCVGAAGSGAAVLAAMKLALPVLGPGPTVGALMGVAGAVGVSLSAAGAVADRYGRSGWVGRLGVTVGAAAAAVLSTAFHSGLSGTFMGLCAAVVPAGLYLQLLLGFICKHCVWPSFKIILCLLIVTCILIWAHFACTDQPDSYVLVPLALIPLLQWIVLLMHTLKMDK